MMNDPFFQLLRQILDEKLLFNTNKPFDRRILEGFVVTAAMNLQIKHSATGQDGMIPERLKVNLTSTYPFFTKALLFVLS